MKLLLATDGSQHAEAALNVILSRPWADGTQVLVLMVAEPLHNKLDKLFAGFGEKAMEARKRLRQSSHDLLKDCEEKLVAKFGEGKVTSQFVDGHAAKEIVKAAAAFGADEIILGSHGIKGDTEFVLGSVTEKVLHQAGRTVEVLKAPDLSTLVTESERGQPLEEDKYLLAIDDSDHSAAMIVDILKRQWRKGAFFKVITVVEPVTEFGLSGVGPWDTNEEEAELMASVEDAQTAEAAALVESVSGKIAAAISDAVVSGEVLMGDPKRKIVDVSRDWPADLIIMGSHGHSGLGDVFVGSVSKAVAAHAPCSVLIHRGK